jgi:heme-degrading monooxygenase HmoA
MHARVTTFGVKPDRADDGIGVFRDAEPQLRDQQGFVDAMLLLDQANSQAMTITIWENEQAIAASSDLARSLFAGAAETMTSPPAMQTCEVLEHRPGSNPRFARVSSGTATAEMMESMRSRQDTSIVDAASRQPGYAGFLVVLDPESRQIRGMSFWDSEEHLNASERAYYTEEMEKSRDNWEGGWTQTIYEVITA